MVNWNDFANERQLLLVLLDREFKGKWDDVAKVFGPDTTGNAIRVSKDIKMPHRWTEEDKLKFYEYILFNSASDIKPNFEAAAAYLGEGLTAKACNLKYYKLKQEAETLIAQGGVSSTPANTPTTNKKKAATTPKSGGPKATKRKAKGADADADDTDGDDIEGTPLKKGRKTAAKHDVGDVDQKNTFVSVNKMEADED